MQDSLTGQRLEVQATAGARPKTGPKGRVLEPYDRDVLAMARSGRSMQYIVNWLAEPPRGVAITRQAVHAWVKARIKKLERLKAAFADTGLEGPFQDRNAVGMTQSAEAITHVKRLSTPMLGPMRAAIRSDHAPTKRVDVEEFMVDESDFERGRNPLLPKL